MMTDPTRLLDDPSIAASLRADLAQAKAVELAGFDAPAGALSLKAAIAAEASAATATAASAGVSKGLMLGLVGAVSIGAVALVTLRSPEPEPVTAVSPPDVVDVAPARPDEVESPMAAVDEPVSPSEPVVLPEAAPEVTAEVVHEVPAEPKAEKTKTLEPKVGRPKARAARATDDYLREAQLIASARRVMQRDPARALKILEEAEASFPRGLLGEEREALTILSLDRLGRTRDAQSRGRAFLDAHGESPYADSVRQVLH